MGGCTHERICFHRHCTLPALREGPISLNGSSHVALAKLSWEISERIASGHCSEIAVSGTTSTASAGDLSASFFAFGAATVAVTTAAFFAPTAGALENAIGVCGMRTGGGGAATGGGETPPPPAAVPAETGALALKVVVEAAAAAASFLPITRTAVIGSPFWPKRSVISAGTSTRFWALRLLKDSNCTRSEEHTSELQSRFGI